MYLNVHRKNNHVSSVHQSLALLLRFILFLCRNLEEVETFVLVYNLLYHSPERNISIYFNYKVFTYASQDIHCVQLRLLIMIIIRLFMM